MKNYTELKRIIINANMGDGEYLDHKIGLVDVLITIKKDKDGCMPRLSLWKENILQIREIEDNCNWDLTEDFDNQKDEIKDFLEEILVK